MTKAELVAKISEETGVSKALAEKCLNAFVSVLSESLAKGERTAIPGLGVFSVKERAERKGRNPQTGKEIVIPARKVPFFRPAKALKEKVK